ncbi:hypothetical protein BDA96_09G193300 [Sorghum bicolor]|uniref:Uncharacterized protein n=2 Tax=Sorghum bicolor TaxID=4558 RepID=A0A921QAJ3_SORBI|nr:hypothetical protein BDA96_09G193300 [Sorghum bicolor]KXG22260.1 hypothetical protein SORBI_3009G182900 [Sorghum bicolor]
MLLASLFGVGILHHLKVLAKFVRPMHKAQNFRTEKRSSRRRRVAVWAHGAGNSEGGFVGGGGEGVRCSRRRPHRQAWRRCNGNVCSDLRNV